MGVAGFDRWSPGDRLPNVRLQSADGAGLTLHSELAGTPLWLVRPSPAEPPAALPEPSPGVTAVCVGPDALTTLPPGWRSFRAEPRWLAGLEADVLWEVDANLRLLARHVLPLQRVLMRRPEIALDAEQTRNIAPVLQIPDVFEPDLCAALINHLEIDCHGGETSRVLVIEGGVQSLQLDPSIKLRRESPPRDPVLEAHMHDRLMRRALPEIARVFSFTVNRRDPFKLLAYPEDAGYFRAHRDNETPDVAHRRFALSINLNHGQYAGGEFRFPEFGLHRYSPPTGAALIFSCSLLHEVLPLRQGTRYAMTTFLS